MTTEKQKWRAERLLQIHWRLASSIFDTDIIKLITVYYVFNSAVTELYL